VLAAMHGHPFRHASRGAGPRVRCVGAPRWIARVNVCARTTAPREPDPDVNFAAFLVRRRRRGRVQQFEVRCSSLASPRPTDPDMAAFAALVLGNFFVRKTTRVQAKARRLQLRRD
jgi:hypothetical protein